MMFKREVPAGMRKRDLSGWDWGLLDTLSLLSRSCRMGLLGADIILLCGIGWFFSLSRGYSYNLYIGDKVYIDAGRSTGLP
jgi:hypothetical protein